MAKSQWRIEREREAKKFNEFLMSLPEPTKEQKERSQKIVNSLISVKSMKFIANLNKAS